MLQYSKMIFLSNCLLFLMESQHWQHSVSFSFLFASFVSLSLSFFSMLSSGLTIPFYRIDKVTFTEVNYSLVAIRIGCLAFSKSSLLNSANIKNIDGSPNNFWILNSYTLAKHCFCIITKWTKPIQNRSYWLILR